MEDANSRTGISRRAMLARSAFALGALPGVAGLLAACAPAPAVPAPTTAPAAPAAVPTQAPPPAKTEALADSLVYAYAAIPDSLDPLNLVSVQGFQAQRLFHEALVILDEKGTVNPLLAESWRNLDPTTWQFVLRRGVKFHNRDDLTSDAVVATIERVLKTRDPLHQLLKSRLTTLAGAQKVDERTVNITTKGPDPMFIRRMGMVFISHPKLYGEGDKTILTNPIGTGPYRPTGFERGSFLTGEAIPNHWRAKPTIMKVRYQQIGEPATMLAGVKAGDIDIAIDVPGSQASDLKVAGLQVLTKPIGATWVYDLSTTLDTPLKDKRVRQALNYAVDKEAILKTLYAGAGRVADGQIVGPEAFGYNPALKPYPYDPAKAKQLLGEAGATSFSVKVGLVPLGKDMTEAVQGYFKAVGVDLEINMLEQSRYVGGTSTNDPPRAPVWWWRTDYFQVLDAELPYRNFHSGFAARRSVSAEFDSVLDEAGKEMDAQKRAALLQQVSAIFRDEIPVLLLHHHGLYWAYSSKVQNFAPRYDVSTNVDEIRKLK